MDGANTCCSQCSLEKCGKFIGSMHFFGALIALIYSIIHFFYAMFFRIAIEIGIIDASIRDEYEDFGGFIDLGQTAAVFIFAIVLSYASFRLFSGIQGVS